MLGDIPSDDFQMQQPSRKRKLNWAVEIKQDECGVSMLGTINDQSVAHDLVNFIYNTHSAKSNTMSLKEEYYSMTFENVTMVDGIALEALAKRCNLIRDIRVKQISVKYNISNMPSINLEIDVYNHDYEAGAVRIPIFKPFKVIQSPLTKDFFMDAVSGGGSTKWNEEWNSPYLLLYNMSHVLCNMEEFPADMGMKMIYEEVDGQKVYGLSVINFEDFAYSVVEYIDIIKQDKFMWSLQFISNIKQAKNILRIKFTMSKGSSDKLILNGEEYRRSYAKRTFSAKIQDTENDPKRQKIDYQFLDPLEEEKKLENGGRVNRWKEFVINFFAKE